MSKLRQQQNKGAMWTRYRRDFGPVSRSDTNRSCEFFQGGLYVLSKARSLVGRRNELDLVLRTDYFEFMNKFHQIVCCCRPLPARVLDLLCSA
jgi:hypothetical protein